VGNPLGQGGANPQTIYISEILTFFGLAQKRENQKAILERLENIKRKAPKVLLHFVVISKNKLGLKIHYSLFVQFLWDFYQQGVLINKTIIETSIKKTEKYFPTKKPGGFCNFLSKQVIFFSQYEKQSLGLLDPYLLELFGLKKATKKDNQKIKRYFLMF
jgi:hypothetical protein